jgi:hypothetical protein
MKIYTQSLMWLALGVSLSTAAIAQERTWLLDATEEEAFLVFGVANTTDIGVSFWCGLGKNEVRIFAPVPNMANNSKIKMPDTLVIGMNITPLAFAKVEGESMNAVEAPLANADSVLKKLADTDHFSVTLQNHKATYPTDGLDIEGFLKHCKEKPLN